VDISNELFHNYLNSINFLGAINKLEVRCGMYKVVMIRHGESEWNKLNCSLVD